VHLDKLSHPCKHTNKHATHAVVGPIVGPLLGGGLSQALGWRSTFASMAVAGAVIWVALLAFMEETHHHHVLKRIRTAEGAAAASAIREARDIARPRFSAPWRPLRYLAEPGLCVHACLTLLLYSTMLSGERARGVCVVGRSFLGCCAFFFRAFFCGVSSNL
jgi:MFS family permease